MFRLFKINLEFRGKYNIFYVIYLIVGIFVASEKEWSDVGTF